MFGGFSCGFLFFLFFLFLFFLFLLRLLLSLLLLFCTHFLRDLTVAFCEDQFFLTLFLVFFCNLRSVLTPLKFSLEAHFPVYKSKVP
ncbi:hypothetical protein I79_008618 [Cricetulus griseus]|uniref:Uncharacterized protein n=1 Tax=Cricetulus griseus TaxID=10029 RepID=G3HDN2_CRIGR|nr:hypothetical protein I79_008618 [Cricetulus griseus]